MADIREAERLEKLAKENIIRAKGIEGLRKKPIRFGGVITNYHEAIEKLHNEISDLYKRAAEEYMKTGRTNEAVEDYRNSLEYAWGADEKERLREILNGLSGKKSGRLFSILSIVSLLTSLFFISFSFTGNAIANLSSENLTLAGTGLFILGLVFAFFYIQEKKR